MDKTGNDGGADEVANRKWRACWDRWCTEDLLPSIEGTPDHLSRHPPWCVQGPFEKFGLSYQNKKLIKFPSELELVLKQRALKNMSCFPHCLSAHVFHWKLLICVHTHTHARAHTCRQARWCVLRTQICVFTCIGWCLFACILLYFDHVNENSRKN